MANLQLRLSDGRGRPIRLTEDAITIGRHPDNRLRIKDEKASRHHCVIEPDPTAPGVFRVRDLGSRNGTRLNGERVAASAITVGDVIAVGDLEFRVENRDAAPAPDGSMAANGKAARATAEPAGPKESSAWIAELEEIERTYGNMPNSPSAELQGILDARGEPSRALEGPADGPRCVALLLRAASLTRATDVHLEPKPDAVHIRMRVDGVMVWVTEIPKRVAELAGGLIKTACQMQAAAKDAIQEGHFSARFSGRRVEYRVSFTPSVQGQKLVLRVLDQAGVPGAIADLGFAPYMMEKIRKVCALDAGMLLCCGPTGSGKTTTLYNCLREIDREIRNVVTIEDPVEYQLDGVTQMPIDEKKGNTFSSLLRSVLRQDPDVILLGEIRDEDTARTAMQAALTGHLVFSTVHAKDTIAAIFRLLDLRVEPYLVANSLSLILAQRLVRALCPTCKSPQAATPGLVTRMGRFGKNVTHINAPVGCKACLKTGYRGRLALFELLEINDELRDVILTTPNIQAIKSVIAQGHFNTLGESGWRLVAEGSTSIEEVERVAG